MKKEKKNSCLSYLVVEIERGQPDGVVDGVLAEYGLEVSGVDRRAVLSDQADQHGREGVAELVEEGQEGRLAAGPVTVLPRVPAIVTGWNRKNKDIKNWVKRPTTINISKD